MAPWWSAPATGRQELFCCSWWCSRFTDAVARKRPTMKRIEALEATRAVSTGQVAGGSPTMPLETSDQANLTELLQVVTQGAVMPTRARAQEARAAALEE